LLLAVTECVLPLKLSKPKSRNVRYLISIPYAGRAKNLIDERGLEMAGAGTFFDVHTTGTGIGNSGSACVCGGKRRLGAKAVIVASDNNRNIQKWIYRYLEPYETKGYVFYWIENNARFSDYAGKADTVMVSLAKGRWADGEGNGCGFNG